MKKVSLVLVGILLVSVLVACGGSKYDEQINAVVKDVDKTLTNVNEQKRNLKREECNFKVYKDGEYVYIEYPGHKDSKKLRNKLVEVKQNKKIVLIPEYKADDWKADYTETNVK